MTDIDLKRLAVDREYWDEVGAPEDATHFSPQKQGFDPCWMKFDGRWRAKHAESTRDTWGFDDPDDDPARYIPRPPKRAQEVEWDGSAFPIPAGTKCEVQMGSFWYPGTVIASTTEAAWFKADQNGEFWTIMNGLSIRPLLTKQQRQREELQAVLKRWHGCKIDTIADAILSKYNLEPKP